jgi:hypothetical protein
MLSVRTRTIPRKPRQERRIAELRKSLAVFSPRPADRCGQRSFGALHTAHKPRRRFCVDRPQRQPALHQREEDVEPTEAGMDLDHGRKGGAGSKPVGSIARQLTAWPCAAWVCSTQWRALPAALSNTAAP